MKNEWLSDLPQFYRTMERIITPRIVPMIVIESQFFSSVIYIVYYQTTSLLSTIRAALNAALIWDIIIHIFDYYNSMTNKFKNLSIMKKLWSCVVCM